jgi:hypothetical protein
MDQPYVKYVLVISLSDIALQGFARKGKLDIPMSWTGPQKCRRAPSLIGCESSLIELIMALAGFAGIRESRNVWASGAAIWAVRAHFSRYLGRRLSGEWFEKEVRSSRTLEYLSFSFSAPFAY